MTPSPSPGGAGAHDVQRPLSQSTSPPPLAPALRPSTSSDPLVHPSPGRLRARPSSVHSAGLPHSSRGAGRHALHQQGSALAGAGAGGGRPSASPGMSGGSGTRWAARAGTDGEWQTGAGTGKGWWTAYRARLGAGEQGVLDRRWEDSTDGELEALLGLLSTVQEPADSAGAGADATPVPASTAAAAAPTLTNEVASASLSPASDRASSSPSTPHGDPEPLFPPSPPLPPHGPLADHPVRILSRALRDVRQALREVEEENRVLRGELRLEQERRRTHDTASGVGMGSGGTGSQSSVMDGAAQAGKDGGRTRAPVSIHESISEALSTSMTSVSPLKARAGSPSPSRSRSPSLSLSTTPLAAPSVRSMPVAASAATPKALRRPTSPAPSTSSRSVRSAFSAQIPGPSSASGAGALSDPSQPDSSPRTGPNGTVRKGMAGWTSGLWVWNRKSVANLRQAQGQGPGQNSEASSSATSVPIGIGTDRSLDPPPYFSAPVSPPLGAAAKGAAYEPNNTGSALGVARADPDGMDSAPSFDTPIREQTGSSPAFRAIFLSTRLLTPDPRSILTACTPSPGLVAYLAHTLVSNARDAGIIAVDPPGASSGSRTRAGSKGRSRAGSDMSRLSVGTDRQLPGHVEGRGRAASTLSAKLGSGGGADAPGGSGVGYGDQARAVGRSLLKGVVAVTASARPTSYSSSSSLAADLDKDATVRPSLLSRLSSSRTLATTALSPSTSSQAVALGLGLGGGQSNTGSGTPGRAHAGSTSKTGANGAPTPAEVQLPTMELASIVPDAIKPPTMTLSRHPAGSAGLSRVDGAWSGGVGGGTAGAGKGKRRLATRFENGEGEVLMDRYGFIYDIQHYALLRDASSAGLSGPRSLLGDVPRSSQDAGTEKHAATGEGKDDTGQEGWVQKQQRMRSDSKSSTRSPRPSISADSAQPTAGDAGPVPAPRGVQRPSSSRGSSNSRVVPSTETQTLEKEMRRTSIDSAASLGLDTQHVSFRPNVSQPRSGTPDSHRSRQSVPSARTDPKSSGPTANTPSVLLVPSPVQPTVSLVNDALTVSLRGKSLQPSPSTSSIHALPDAPSSPTLAGSPAPANRATIASLVSKLNELHDAHEAARQKEWDRWFARRAFEGSASGLAGTSGAGLGFNLSAESELGQRTLLGLEEMALRGPKGEEEQKELARLIRGGVPAVYRAQVWAECSGAKDRFVPGDYADLVTVYTDYMAQQRAARADGQRTPGSPRFKSVDAKVLGEIEKDVVRTFPSNVYFGGDGVGVDKLRRVLVAYSLYDPLTGYCQGMNMLAATLLLVFPEEEQAFHTLVALLSSSHLLPLDYFSTSLLASRADQVVLSQYAKKILPKVSRKLEQEGVALESVSWGWFGGIFGGCLGVETLFRVWDVFFFEGHDVLFRTALAILKLAEPEILACESAADLFGVLSGMMGRTWSADRLITLQHSFKDQVKREDVRKRCDKARRELRAQEALAEAM